MLLLNALNHEFVFFKANCCVLLACIESAQMRRQSSSSGSRKRKSPEKEDDLTITCENTASAADNASMPGDPLSADESTLIRINRVLDWHSQHDCLSEVPVVSTFDTRTLLDSIPFCKLLASIRPTVKGQEIPLVTRVYEEQYM